MGKVVQVKNAANLCVFWGGESKFLSRKSFLCSMIHETNAAMFRISCRKSYSVFNVNVSCKEKRFIQTSQKK